MSILRENPFTNEWTLYAESRGKRPHDFAQKTELVAGREKECPFCKENDKITSEIVYWDKKDWNICVVPNLYPIISHENAENIIEQEAFYNSINGVGHHEVLVDTADHSKTVDQFSEDEMAILFKTFDNRYEYLSNENNAKYVQIFKNNGASAGMSIKHSHWQIVSLPVLPEREKNMSAKMEVDNCLFCKMLNYELEKENRVIAESEYFVALAPYSSRMAYEVWIAPKRHFAHFSQRTKEENTDLIKITQLVLKKLVKIKPDVSYNICFMEGELKKDNFHWHIQILPRIDGFAGFELATNSYINSILPEEVKIEFDKIVL